MRTWICCVDRRARIVMRNRRAVALGFVQFAIFDALHSQGAANGKQLSGDRLADAVYHGARNPSTRQTIHVCIYTMNKKLAHLGLKIRGVNRRQHSFYQIVGLP